MPDKNHQQIKLGGTIGIFGGGQLGQMTCFAARKLGYKTLVFSDIDNCPAKIATDEIIVADYLDKKALQEFADKIDIATLEFENIPVEAVDFIAKQKPVYPGADVLKITQNRLREKDFVNSIGIKTTDYRPIHSLKDLQEGLKEFGFKAVLKTATMGYDGKGQQVLNQNNNLEEIWKNFSGQELILEKFSDFDQEISAIVARSVNKEISCYEPLTNIHKNGILNQSIYPAKVSEKTAKQAIEIASKIAGELNLIGLLAVEFFVLKDGSLLVNELAPRPHNSGHFSMDACHTSQFEQLIRAICGLSLGDVSFHSQGYMQNLIGDDVLKMEKYQQNQQAKIHLYGKDKIAAGRKMGHVNIIS
ncbi:MAG: 5-(carboxyamino)imidazole ribonucleotide synthase [Rickettsiaceae bacterium]|jgi:5-(carboxyamino)imidazole ribonucleotide synthase|nr:5-(carboxyamino)imidazole ribonucleotide synthase [Rickettsiaceae bacterium]